jgi:hypothetical protein
MHLANQVHWLVAHLLHAEQLLLAGHQIVRYRPAARAWLEHRFQRLSHGRLVRRERLRIDLDT